MLLQLIFLEKRSSMASLLHLIDGIKSGQGVLAFERRQRLKYSGLSDLTAG
jgi:hypothetical protein